jgi:hypothetical protein
VSRINKLSAPAVPSTGIHVTVVVPVVLVGVFFLLFLLALPHVLAMRRNLIYATRAHLELFRPTPQRLARQQLPVDFQRR